MKDIKLQHRGITVSLASIQADVTAANNSYDASTLSFTATTVQALIDKIKLLSLALYNDINKIDFECTSVQIQKLVNIQLDIQGVTAVSPKTYVDLLIAFTTILNNK